MTGTDNDWRLLLEPGASIADFRTVDDHVTAADRRDGKLYRYSPDVKLAVRVALAVGRPLLVFGPSGCGKSSLVFNLARLLKRRYYEFVVSSRSDARELFYRFDAVRRLGEAQIGSGASESWRSCYPFIDPGPLWWVLSPDSARWRGAPPDSTNVRPAIDPGRWPDDFLDPADRGPAAATQSTAAVLLIDEIDKADPDFANNLLVPLGSSQFIVEESGDVVKLTNTSGSEAPVVVITSNRERELPTAFVRRCVVLEIMPPSDDELLEIARAHYPAADARTIETWGRIATLANQLHRKDRISSPEFLDAIVAIEKLGEAESKWKEILLRTTWTTDFESQGQL